MKRILVSAAFGMAGMLDAQGVQSYSYVAPLQQLKDFNSNQYGLTKLLIGRLAQKNYTVLPADRAQWPAQANQNPCSVLLADLDNSSSLLKNKVKVVFKDCNGKTLAAYEGASNEKEFETGYPDALNKALLSLPGSAPSASAVLDKAEIKPAAPAAFKIPETPAQNNASSRPDGEADIYFFNGTALNRIVLSAGQFILVSPDSSTPFAVFTESGKSGAYHVKMANGTFGIGYYEGAKLVMEQPASDGSIARTEFLIK